MTVKIYLHIAFRIILMCLLGMAFTYVPDHLRDFFGDKLRNKGAFTYEFGGGLMDTDWNWGARHYWYYWTSVALFILSIVTSISTLSNVIEEDAR